MNPRIARLILNIQTLPDDEIKAVEKFVDSLHPKATNERLTQTTGRLSEDSFRKVWNNPEDAIYDKL